MLFLDENIWCDPHEKCLCETVLLRGHNICLYRKIWKIKPKLSLLFLLIWARLPSTVGSCLTKWQRSRVRYPVWPHTFISPSADSKRAVVSYWQKCVHKVLINCLGGLSLPRKSEVRLRVRLRVRLTDHPNMTLAVYHGCKTK